MKLNMFLSFDLFVTCYIVFVKKKRSKAKNNIIFSDQISKIYSLRT